MRHVLRPLVPVVVLIVIAGVPSVAATQDPARPDSNAEASRSRMDTGATSLQTVRVRAARRTAYAPMQTLTATRTPTPLRDVPQAITVISRDLIRDAGMHGMADAVRFVPGVAMGQGEGNRDQPTIRGHNTTADFFVDGVRDDAQYFRDLYNVERVEALKGSNAMIFGRGGGGGVLNRVTKEATWTPVRELIVQGGSFDNKRASIDLSGGMASRLAMRVNGMSERSGFFRDGVRFRRSGINPTFTIAPGPRTRIAVGYEYFTDHRTADRGIPSFNGRPVESDVTTFFGDPDASYSDARVHAGAATVTHEPSARFTIRNRTRYTDYDKFYQNVFPGAVNATGDAVSLAAYNNATRRRNVFNQTDLVSTLHTGPVGHTLLVGGEIGRQSTHHLRETGYFSDVATSISVPLSNPTISAPVVYRQSATDPDNHVVAAVASVYVQDQLVLSEQWQLVVGLRYEHFDVRYDDNRTDATLSRADDMISPRIGLLFKPRRPLSFYASHSVSYLPGSGDQFSSLTDVTRALEPEQFRNYEVGAKWDVGEALSLTAAAYRLDRTNTRALDPTDPARTLQTGSQRTNGIELGATGRIAPWWEIAGGYANQDAFITSATAAAPTGARAPLVPRNMVSLWNRYQLASRFGVGVGVIHRSDMYAAIDNRVTLSGFTEIDGALYLGVTRYARLQANIENVLNSRYYVTAHNNNNISPGSRRAVRISVASGF